MMQVNKQGQDWLLVKAKLGEIIVAMHDAMERGLSIEEYNLCRGQVATARELIEWVEPSTPPLTEEDSYGISNPEE